MPAFTIQIGNLVILIMIIFSNGHGDTLCAYSMYGTPLGVGSLQNFGIAFYPKKTTYIR